VVKWLWGQRGRYTALDLRAPSNDGWQSIHSAASGGQLEVRQSAQPPPPPTPNQMNPNPNSNPNPNPNPDPNPDPDPDPNP
jgi:hypothetical protein